MADPIRLDGRVALVTGAGGDIGAAAIHKLAERGAAIVAVDRDDKGLKKALGDLPAGTRSLSVIADVTDEQSVRDYVGRAIVAFAGIQVFFINAGIEGAIAGITGYDAAEFRRVLDVNVAGVSLGLKHVIPVMRAQGRGSIVATAFDRRLRRLGNDPRLYRQQACGYWTHPRRRGRMRARRHQGQQHLPRAPSKGACSPRWPVAARPARSMPRSGTQWSRGRWGVQGPSARWRR